MSKSSVQVRLNCAQLSLCGHLLAESQRFGQFLNRRISMLVTIWFIFAVLAGGLKILLLRASLTHAAMSTTLVPQIVPYALIALAPAAGWAIVGRCCAHGTLAAQPKLRLAKVGSWTSVSSNEAHQRQYFGMSGLLVSLVAGLLLSMLMRLGEYLLAIPAIPATAPRWALAMFDAMTFDLVYLSFLYSVCIAMALKAAPLFPRMLAYTWLCDLLMQGAIARYTINAGGLPSEVAAPLQAFLLGNIKKVLISVMIWLPYLLVSNRVNVTFRQRVRHQTIFAW